MMAIDERDARTPGWRNALTWTGASFAVYLVLVLGLVALEQDGLGGLFERGPVIGTMALALLVAAGIVGLSKRSKPLTLREFRNFVILSTLAIAIFILIRWGLTDAIAFSALGVSAAVALIFGMLLVGLAVLGLLLTAAAHARLGLQTAEQAETLLEHGRVLPYSLVVTAAMGLTLVLLGLAAPAGPLSPGVALAGVAALVAIETVLTLMIWPRIDELSQTLSRETGNAAYYLIVILGGGGAILAHLGFVPAPAPLDWLTMLTVIMFAASVIATARRGMLQAG